MEQEHSEIFNTIVRINELERQYQQVILEYNKQIQHLHSLMPHLKNNPDLQRKKLTKRPPIFHNSHI